jgi:phage portal protein BeeE
MGLFRRRREQRADTYTLEQLLADYGTPTFSGEQVTPDSALRLSAVWSCVNLLASTVSELPVDAYRKGERDEIPLPPVLQEPSAGTELPEFTYAVMSSLLLRGNCYGLITARSGPGMLRDRSSS